VDADLAFRRARRGAARRRPRTRPHLHRPAAARARPRGNHAAGFGHARTDGSRSFARSRDCQPPAVFHAQPCRRAQAVAHPAAQRDRRLLAEQVYADGRDAAAVSRRRGSGDGRAFSPQTRNKQVALYQSGEVDYLVATDAIGMGLNLDIGHVAFAGLSKFDGIRQRRLTTAEMAQIAGRAGRHQRDGTFRHAGGHRRPRCGIHRRGSLRDRGTPLPAADPAVLARG
jgi:hypothetical protein